MLFVDPFTSIHWSKLAEANDNENQLIQQNKQIHKPSVDVVFESSNNRKQSKTNSITDQQESMTQPQIEDVNEQLSLIEASQPENTFDEIKTTVSTSLGQDIVRNLNHNTPQSSQQLQMQSVTSVERKLIPLSSSVLSQTGTEHGSGTVRNLHSEFDSPRPKSQSELEPQKQHQHSTTDNDRQNNIDFDNLLHPLSLASQVNHVIEPKSNTNPEIDQLKNESRQLDESIARLSAQMRLLSLESECQSDDEFTIKLMSEIRNQKSCHLFGNQNGFPPLNNNHKNRFHSCDVNLSQSQDINQLSNQFYNSSYSSPDFSLANAPTDSSIRHSPYKNSIEQNKLNYSNNLTPSNNFIQSPVSNSDFDSQFFLAQQLLEQMRKTLDE